MNLQTTSSLVATLLPILFSTAFTATASEIEASQLDSESQNPITEQLQIANTTARLATKEPIAKINTHHHEQLPAATVYVRSIPIVTFITADKTTENFHTTPHQDKVALAQVNSPLERATTVARRINTITSENFDAQQIDVIWDSDSKSYKIKVAGVELLAINEANILPDTTGNLTEDARQATNRLRRLLGNAAPLAEIPSIPQPESIATNSASASKSMTGIASWYGPGFHGRLSASGERYNQNAMTAAHRSLPFGTMVRVTNVNNGRSVVVRINDRGPFIRGRVIDISAAAARVLGIVQTGIAPVSIEIIGRK